MTQRSGKEVRGPSRGLFKKIISKKNQKNTRDDY